MAGKKYQTASKTIDREKRYPLEEAIKMVSGNKVAKFDETVETAIRLNVDPRQADQNVRGTVVLPNGTAKTARVLVLTKGDKEREAREAGRTSSVARTSLRRYRKRTGSTSIA